jgi:hypothetical protein
MYMQSMFRLFRTPVRVSKMSLFSCISSEGLMYIQSMFRLLRKMSLFSCISSEGPMYIQSMFRLFRTPVSVRKMSLFSCISSERSDVHSVNVQSVQNSCQREEDVPVQLYLQ